MHTFQIRALLQETAAVETTGPALVEIETIAAAAILAGFIATLLAHLI